MPDLPTSGVELVAKGADAYVGDIGKAARATDAFFGGLSRGAGASGAFGEVITGALRRVGEVAVDALGQAAQATAGFLKDSLAVAGDFEQTMNVLGATSGATAADLEKVHDKAVALGADLSLPATSANDAAQAMLELSKAGMTVNQAMDAAKGTLQLAAAAETDAATAAQIMSGALNAFELPASDAVRIADLLAAGANASSASMTDLSQGLQQAGFAFHAAGLPAEDLVTSLAALTNVGLTGSDAGTALKNAMMRLMNPTDKAAGLMAQLGFNAYDAQGKMKSWPQIIHDLNKALDGMTEEQRNAALGTIFLSDGMKAMIPLLNLGDEGFAKLKKSVTEQGAAAKVAQAQMQGWNGAVAGLQSQIETLQLIIGEKFLPLLTPLAQQAAVVAGQFTTFAQTFLNLVPAIQASDQPIQTFLQALGIAASSVIPGAGTALIALAGPVQTMVDGLASLAQYVVTGKASLEGMAQGAATVASTLGVSTASVMAAVAALHQIWEAAQSVAATLGGVLATNAQTTQAVFSTLAEFFLGTVLPAVADLATWFADNLPVAIAAVQAAVTAVTPYAQQLADTFMNQILPAAVAVWTTFQSQVMPILAQLGTIVAALVTGSLTVFASYWTNVLAPGLTALWGIFTNQVLPVLGELATWLGATLPPIIQTIADFLSGTFFPALNTIGSYIADPLIPALTNLGRFAFAVVYNAVVSLYNKLNQALHPMLTAVASVTKGPLSDAMTAVAPVLGTVEKAVHAVASAFHAIADAIGAAIKKVKEFIDAASKIKVPALVTPGSPTPLEIGLRGIADAATVAGSAIDKNLGSVLAGFATGDIAKGMEDLVKASGGKGKGGGGGGGGGSATAGPPVPLDYSGAESLGQWAGFFSALTSMNRAATAQPPTGSSTSTSTTTNTVNYAPVYQTGTPPPPTMDAAVAASMVP